MRISSWLIGAAAVALASAASAQTIEPVSYSPQFQNALEEDYGTREASFLNDTLTRYVSEALARRGASASDVRIELTIVEARPNRPTMQQMSDTIGLDPIRSISIGGAELRAVLRDGSGAVVGEVEHRYFAPDLLTASYSAATWGDAQRSMRRFADKVAVAYTGR